MKVILMMRKIEIIIEVYIDVLKKTKEIITQAQYQVITNANIECNKLFWYT